MRIENYNSTHPLTPDQINYALGHLGFLASTAVHVPLYLVNEKTIDEIYPPEKREDFNEGCLKEIFFMYENEKRTFYERLKSAKENKKETKERPSDDTREQREEYKNQENHNEEIKTDSAPDKTINELEKNLYHQIESCMNSKQTLTALGVYLKTPNLDRIPNSPSIFICPEKIDAICEGYIEKKHYTPEAKGEITTTLFTEILLHELTHAYLKTDERITHKPFGKVIEETLCNATAFEQFDTWQGKSLLMRFHSQQPVSYRGYTFWHNRDITIRSLLSAWKEKSERCNSHSGIDQYLLFILFLCENKHFFSQQRRSEIEWDIGRYWYREITNRHRHQIFSYDPDIRDQFLRYRNAFQYYERLSAKILKEALNA